MVYLVGIDIKIAKKFSFNVSSIWAFSPSFPAHMDAFGHIILRYGQKGF